MSPHICLRGRALRLREGRPRQRPSIVDPFERGSMNLADDACTGDADLEPVCHVSFLSGLPVTGHSIPACLWPGCYPQLRRVASWLAQMRGHS